MADQNLRVWPVEGDTYGEVIEYPHGAKTRFEPHEPGQTGAMNTDLVVYTKDDEREEHEIGRHTLADVLLVWPGQPTPDAVLASERDRLTTVSAADTASSSSSSTTPAKTSSSSKMSDKK